MRQIKVTVGAGVSEEIAVHGDYVRVKVCPVELRIEAPESGEFAELAEGEEMFLSPFRRLKLSHASGASQVVTLLIGQGTRVGSAKLSGSVVLSGQQGACTQAQVTVTNASTLLRAANASRRLLLVQNKGAGNIFVELDGAAATVGAGLRLGSGDSLLLDAYCPSGAVYAIGDIASNPDVVVVEG